LCRYAAEQEAAARVARLERDLQFAAVDLKMCAEKMDKLDKDKANIERELRGTLPELAAAEKACEVAAAEVSKLEAQVNAIEDTVYADFSKSVGVANIREYEAHNLATLQRAAEERAKFTQQRAKLTEQLNFENSRDTEGPRAKAQADIGKHEAGLYSC
jgi:structural maintenance of chromosome 1